MQRRFRDIVDATQRREQARKTLDLVKSSLGGASVNPDSMAGKMIARSQSTITEASAWLSSQVSNPSLLYINGTVPPPPPFGTMGK